MVSAKQHTKINSVGCTSLWFVKATQITQTWSCLETQKRNGQPTCVQVISTWNVCLQSRVQLHSVNLHRVDHAEDLLPTANRKYESSKTTHERTSRETSQRKCFTYRSGPAVLSRPSSTKRTDTTTLLQSPVKAEEFKSRQHSWACWVRNYIHQIKCASKRSWNIRGTPPSLWAHQTSVRTLCIGRISSWQMGRVKSSVKSVSRFRNSLLGGSSDTTWR